MQWSITLNQLWLDYRPGTCVAGTSELDYSKEPVEMDLEVSESDFASLPCYPWGERVNSLLFSFYILFQFDVIIYRVIISHVCLLSRLLY